MRSHLKRAALAATLWAVSGSAFAQCEQLQVIIRDQIWKINNLDAFCQDYKQLKSDVARLIQNLARLEQENRELRAKLEVESSKADGVALGKP